MDEIYSMLKRPFDGTWERVESNKAAFEYIMSWLPVKSILIFKSISKFWYDVMSKKYFIILHRHLSKTKAKFLAFYDASGLEGGIVREMHLMEPNGTYSESYTIPGFEALHNPHIISSFNGLICCINDMNPGERLYDQRIHICNPATREIFALPSSHLLAYMPFFGVLYSNRHNIYKIFKFSINPIIHEMSYSQCEVYSSRTGEWELLKIAPTYPLMNPNHSLISNNVSINEKLYWFIANAEEFYVPSSILMVDMNYNFREIPLPTKAEISFLIEFQDQLCFVDWTGMSFYIWIYDEKESWYLKDIPPFPGNWLEVAEFNSVVAHKHEILFVYKDVTGMRHEILYDVLYATWKDFSIAEDNKDKAIVVVPFFETLVSCSNYYVFSLDQRE